MRGKNLTVDEAGYWAGTENIWWNEKLSVNKPALAPQGMEGAIHSDSLLTNQYARKGQSLPVTVRKQARPA